MARCAQLLKGSTALAGAAIAALALPAAPARAQTFTFIGGSGSLWGAPGSWDIGAVPDSATAQVLLPDPTLNTSLDLGGGTFTVNRLTFAPTGNRYGILNGTLIFDGANATIDVQPSGAYHTFTTLLGPVSVVAMTDLTINTAVGGLVAFEGATISGPGALIKTGGGSMLLGGANSYGGGTVVEAGTLTLIEADTLGTGPLTVNGGSLDLNGFSQSVAGLSGTGGIIDLGSAMLTTTSAGSASYGGVVTGTGTLVKDGAGTLTLTGTNTYTGGTVINAGTLALSGTGRLAASGAVSIASGAGFRIDASSVNETIGSLSGSGSVALGANTLTFGNVTNQIFAGSIGGTGGIVKQGSGRQTLTGSNTYTGGTTINAGTLALSGAGSLAASGSLDLANAGTGFDISASAANQTIGSLSGFGSVTLGANTLTFGNVTNRTFAGWIGGTGGIVKQGSGRQTLTGINTYLGGTTITAGTLGLLGAGSLAASGDLNLAGAGAEFDIGAADGSRTIGGLLGVTGSTIWLGANTLTFGDATNQTFAGSIGGSGGITKQGTGRQTLTGINTYLGGTTINDGTLALSGAGSLAASGSLSLSGTGAGFDISGASGSRTVGALSGGAGSTITLGANTLTFGSATNQVFAGSIGGTGGIVKQGTGRQTLSGISTYSGITTVSAGELRVDGALTGPGAVTVSAGATLSGTGSIAGAVTVDGTLSAGHSPGTLTVGSLTLNSGSTSVFELNTPGVVGGSNPVTGNDLVEVTGNLTLGGALDARAAAAGYYRLFDYGGTLTGSFDTQSVTSSRGGFTIAGAQVDTAVAGQVNLAVLGAGQTMQFWDGANTSANGTVNGGAGTWSGFGTNWTDSAGGANGGWGGSVGIFAGAAGGAVSVSGMVSFDTLQFSTNGYVLSGGTLAIAPASGGAGTFNVDNGITASIASTIDDGSGTAITKVGGGTLILSGNNSYTGGTAIDGGTLQVSADANLGAISGGLTFDGGTLRTTASFSSARNVILNAAGGIFQTDADLSWSGVISGSGALTKTGSGTLILTGTNTYAGGTTIIDGVLQIGDGGTSGSITGAVVNNSTLAFNRSNDIAFADAISGTGNVQKRGSGSLTLTGANSYSGGTLIAQGTLIGSASSFGTGQITNNGALVIDQPTDASFANAINGSGSFTKRGAGNLVLTGASALIGSTTVEAGKLSVNASLAASTVRVLSGAVLGGSGTVGGIVANAGATVSPGNSIGTLTVSGNVSFAAGSTYQVEVNAAGQSDRIAASGSATLNGGAVQVLAENGNYAASTNYTILTASGGVSGTFSTVTSNLAFLTPSLNYDSQNVTLTMTRNDTGFGPGGGDTGGGAGTDDDGAGNYVATSRNQGFIANAAERLGAGNPVYDALLSATAAEARAGFDLLSGEAHAQAVSVMIDESRLVREAILNRLRGPVLSQPGQQVAASFSADPPGRKGAVLMAAPVPQPRFALWGEAFGSAGNSNADGNAAGLSRRSGGALLGADLTLYDEPGSSLKIGVAGGYSQSRFDLDSRLSTGRLESGHAALYAGARFGNLRLDAGAAYSWSESDIRRQVAIRGFGDLLRLQRPGSVTQGFAELGYGFAFSGVALEPFAQLALIKVSTEAGTERGGAAALRVLSSEQTLGFTTLGLRAEAQIGAMPLFARAMLGWRHGFGELTPQARTVFVAGTTPATVFAAPIDREALVAEAGLDWRLTQATALGLTYSAAIGERSRDHALKGRVEMRF
jgi:fibronectin-binding autotransporter adhesin